MFIDVRLMRLESNIVLISETESADSWRTPFSSITPCITQYENLESYHYNSAWPSQHVDSMTGGAWAYWLHGDMHENTN